MNRVRLIPVVLLLVALLAMAACGGGEAAVDEAAPTTAVEAAADPAGPTEVPTESEPAAVPEPTQEPEPTAEPAPTEAPEPTEAPASADAPAGDLDAYLATVLRNQLTSGPYRTTTTFEDEAAGYVIIGEVVPPDRFHVTTTGGGLDSEMIIIGDDGWMKLDGAWSPLPSGMGATMLQGVMQQDPATIGVNSNVQFLGSEDLDGVRTWVITYDSALEGISTASVKAWIDAERDVIIRQEILGEAGGVESNAVQTVEFDDGITVEPPQE